jgi:hypothetical protein
MHSLETLASLGCPEMAPLPPKLMEERIQTFPSSLLEFKSKGFSRLDGSRLAGFRQLDTEA